MSAPWKTGVRTAADRPSPQRHGLTATLRLTKTRVAVLLVLVVALGLRLYGLRAGLPALNDPDELMFELGAFKMLRSFSLNPGWFGHPATTTMYMLALTNIVMFIVGHGLGWFEQVRDFANAIYGDPTWVILPGRVVMVAFAVATISMTYRIGARLFDPAAGLFAAAMLALNPVHVTYSQVIRSDIMAMFFMLLCLDRALSIARDDRWRDYVLAALWLGLATATKWPFALTGVCVAGAAILRLRAHPGMERQILLRLAGFAMLSIGFLVMVSPYLLLDYPVVLKNLQGEAQAHHLGANGGSALWNAGWYLSGPILSGLGWLGCAFAVLGMWMVRRMREAAALFIPLVITFAVLLVGQSLVWERWALPLMPIFALAAGVAFVRCAAALRAWLGGRVAFGAVAFLGAATVLPLALANAAAINARMNDTRQQASQWARQHIPPASTVLLEHFAFDLLPQPWHFLFPLGDFGCVDANAYLHGKVAYATIESGRGKRANVDFGTLPAERVHSCRADYAIITQYDRYAAERSLYPAEHKAYQTLASQGTEVAKFVPTKGVSAGPVVRIYRFSRK